MERNNHALMNFILLSGTTLTLVDKYSTTLGYDYCMALKNNLEVGHLGDRMVPRARSLRGISCLPPALGGWV